MEDHQDATKIIKERSELETIQYPFFNASHNGLLQIKAVQFMSGYAPSLNTP